MNKTECFCRVCDYPCILTVYGGDGHIAKKNACIVDDTKVAIWEVVRK